MIVGIRPEDFEDAELAGDQKGFTFEAPIEMTESMGSEVYAHFSYEGDGVSSDELQELAADSGAADVPGAGAEHAVARLDPTTGVERGQRAKLWLDVAKLHLFDPEDGRSLVAKS